MKDARTGRVHNYLSVGGLLAQGLVNWGGSAEALWNAAEKSETRRNARVARELRPALPAELPLEEQLRLVVGMSCWLKDIFGVAVHYVIHAPRFHDEKIGKRLAMNRETAAGEAAYIAALSDPEITNQNYHAHVRFTTRVVDEVSGNFQEKTRDLDSKETGAACVLMIRKEWEKRVNAALARAGSASRIDLTSYEDMAAAGEAPVGLKPQRHTGPKRSAIERRTSRSSDEKLCSQDIERAGVRCHNQALWVAWEIKRAEAREAARKEGLSAEIAAAREKQRREAAEVEARRTCETESPDPCDAMKAKIPATVVRSDGIMDTSMNSPAERSVKQRDPVSLSGASTAGDAWAQATRDVLAGRSLENVASEFDKVVDPETYEMPVC